MVTRREWYQRVNQSWPADVPTLTADEAVRAARRLYRYGWGIRFAGKVVLTSGRRRNRMSYGQIVINPAQGWKELVHLLSHYAHRYRVRTGHFAYKAPDHSADHAMMERRMIKEVLRRGWLQGKLRTPEKPASAPVDQRAEAKVLRYKRTLAAIDRWERKLRRAESALKKLRRRARYYRGPGRLPEQVLAETADVQ